ncbi:LysR family transcriptional regulator [Halalkalibacterium ligniniphilum]|uniref:LysR family transcriptional regulator n=1 Tax=Halalkalibacterium ligniniphilum TaxID=1134413 RepID=UPI00034881D4|nr:LysR family transcriptional regulator [Halalkalibacterium ligniniphilum]
MDLDSIQSFIVMAESESLTEAANQLYLNPSSLTGRIKKIEKELGEPLFILKGRTLQLSPAGKVFLTYAKQFYTMGLECNKELLRNEDKSVRFRLAATPLISTYILPRLIREFQHIHPELEMEIYSCKSYEIRKYIFNDEVDLGIIQRSDIYESIDYKHWFTDMDVMVVSSEHPWAKRDEIRLGELYLQPLLAFQRHTFMWKKRIEWIRNQGVNPWIGMELNHIETIKEILLNHYGYSFLPRYSIKNELAEGSLVEIKMERSPIWERNTFFIANEKEHLSSIYIEFIDFAIERTEGEFLNGRSRLIS